jgi:hypothetical protein
VRAGHPGVGEPQVGLGAAADHRHPGVQQVFALRRPAGGGEDEPGPQGWRAGCGRTVRPAVGRGGRRRARGGRRLGDDGAADPEDAGAELRDLLELHLDRADEGPALLVGVLPDHAGELGAQRLVVLAQPAGVGGAELDDVGVGDQDAPLTDDRPLVGGLPLEGGGHLDRLDDTPEDAREGTLDEASQPALEALQHSHAGAPSLSPEIVSAPGRGPGPPRRGC